MRLQPPAFPDPLKPYNDLLTIIYECIDEDEDIESFEFSDTGLEAFRQSKLEFHHCQFKNCQFLSSGLTHTFFADVIFTGCDLSNLNLGDSTFHRVVFKNCKLLGTDFNACILEECHFTECLGNFMNFSTSKTKHVLFENCPLQNVSFQDCKLKTTQFQQCDLTEADFLHTPLKGIDFTSDTLSRITVSGSQELRGAVVNLFQAAELSRLLGVVIKE